MKDSENPTGLGKFLLFAGRNDSPGQCWDTFLAAFDSPAIAESTGIHMCRNFGYDWWEIVSAKTLKRFKLCHGERFKWFEDFEDPHEDLGLPNDAHRVKRLIQHEVSHQHKESGDPELTRRSIHSHLERLLHPDVLADLQKDLMPYDLSCSLWPNREDAFFRERTIEPLRQVGPHCVSTVLAMLAGQSPETFQGRVNTQDPVSWSIGLRPFGLRLAYCPTDVRKLGFYLPELLALDDLFTISYYSPADGSFILQDPDSDGWICGSHIVILHRELILDPASGLRLDAKTHHCLEHHTKRIFRVVPDDHERGL